MYLRSNGNLGAGVAELRKRSMKEPILLAERQLARARSISLFSLKRHVCVCDFRNIRQEEHECKRKYKDRNGEVHPLYVFQRLGVVKGEEDV